MARVQGAREEHDRPGIAVERFFNRNRRLAKDVRQPADRGFLAMVMAIPGALATRSPTQADFQNRLWIPGVTQLTSASALGITQLTVQFDLSRDVDGAATDVLAAINAACPYLPQGIPYPPTIRKVKRPTRRS